MAAGTERVPPDENQAAFLRDGGENPDDWHRIDNDTVTLAPLDIHCESVARMRCQRRKDHTGDHVAMYFSGAGLGHVDRWGPTTDHMEAKARGET